MTANHQMPDRVERRLTAILAADVEGYSRHIGRDDVGAMRMLVACRESAGEKIAQHRGRIIDTAGDSIMAEFGSVVDAVACALEIQKTNTEAQRDLASSACMSLRIGIHIGDVVVRGTELFGDGVNVAARLQALAEPGGVCVSGAVWDQVRRRMPIAATDLGTQSVKNIADPVQAFMVRYAAAPSSTATADVPAPKLPDKPSIAVLPFDNMSAEAGQDYLADGIVEAITAALSRIRSFFVIARNSAFTYKGRAANVRDIGKELGVAYLLEGSVQKVGSRLRITVQLIETEGSAHVWSARYDGTVEDIFDLQDRITEQVAGALQPSIRIAEIERSRRRRPQDLGAYDYTMQAMPHVWALEKEESAKALALLDKALAADPHYPLALSLAGWCHAQRSVYNWAEEIPATQAQARSLAERAAELSGDDPIILAVLGAVHTFLRNHGTARILLERAVALDPNSAWAWSRLAWLDNYAERPQGAIEKFERALRLSPFDPMNFNNYVGLGSAHEILGEHAKAVSFYRRALEERPNATWIYRNLTGLLVATGEMDAAKEAYARLMQAYPDLTVAKYKQAMVFGPAALERMADRLRQLGLPEE